MVWLHQAEEPLPPGGSCLLGALNLVYFVDENGKFNFDDFSDAARTAVDALNNVLDEGLERHPLQEQRDSVRDWRQIGLGIMGLADMLIKMRIRYGSQRSIELCNEIGELLVATTLDESCRLAEKHGAYKMWNIEVLESSFYQGHKNAINKYYPGLNERIHKYGLRNSQLLTIAPTGTISTMIGVSGGIEPIFANSYTRMTKSLYGEDVAYKVYTPIVKEYMDKYDITEEENLPEWFVTSSTIPIKERIAMQSVWQKHIDASISSTVNLPHETTVEEVENLYMAAWENGLKGVTVYRAGCAREGILTTTDTKEQVNNETNNNITLNTVLPRGAVISVSDDLIGKKRKLQTGCGSLHCTAFFDPCTGDLMETYLSKGSTGGCDHTLIGLSRMISLASRSGVSINDIVDQLNSTGTCASYAVRRAVHKDTSKGACCPMAVGNALMDMYKEMQNDLFAEEVPTESINKSTITNAPKHTVKIANKCPECGEDLIFEGGCCICKSCGYSRCN